MGKLELLMETDKVSIYSPKYDGEEMTEFEKFLLNHSSHSEAQLKCDFESIIAAIDKMLKDCGARENLFRPEGRNVVAIPLVIQQRRKKDIGTIRLYCIRFSDRLLIIGNGGIKTTRRYEDDPILADIVETLRKIEHSIFARSKKLKLDYDDFDTLKKILETTII